MLGVVTPRVPWRRVEEMALSSKLGKLFGGRGTEKRCAGLYV